MSTSPPDAPSGRQRPRWVAMVLPAAVVWTGWLILMASGDRWGLFTASHGADSIPNWYMSLTMAVGSFIAGATSEGGGAVAFPVMTLFFEVAPPVARDFSLMIQAVGMNAAAFAIFYMAVRVERHALLWSTLGGAVGVILGMEYIAGLLPPAFAKMLFISCWLAFAVGLYWINRYHDRETHLSITHFLPRHAVLLSGTGIIGGVITSITGSGLDIATFALLVLRLRISERVATPTSVCLMAFNAAIAFGYKHFVMEGAMEPEAWGYWYVCVPIVVVGAPFGAWFIKNKSRLFISGILYASIAIQFVSALIILKVFAEPQLALFSTAIFAAGVGFFWFLAHGGSRRLEWLTETGKGAEHDG